MDLYSRTGIERSVTTSPSNTPPVSECPSHGDDLLTSCVHCGFCLEVCPTYKLTGDENNSPRGRLRLWREESEGRLVQDPWTDFYTSECVGCLACESACPANVPYGQIFEQVKHQHVATNRSRPPLVLRIAATLAARPALFNLAMLPARLLRRLGLLKHRFVFQGDPAALQSTADYTRQLMDKHRPTGPRAAFLTGCLMESLFREINFATVRVLIENNVQVVIPADQGCCGAFQEHTGMAGVEALHSCNRQAFGSLNVDAIVSNSSGCGLALSKSLHGIGEVQDVLSFLGKLDPVSRPRRTDGARVYVDLPCHLIHGQKVAGIPTNVLNATGYQWELAPQARDCCGSGGVYNIQKPENSREILSRKAAFLNEAVGNPVILATSNHVCMMQWNSARTGGLVNRPYQVKHVIQLLDPGEGLTCLRNSHREHS
jgi:glycolate oxidase iron-sulfur subunit